MSKKKTYPSRGLGREGKYEPLVRVESEELEEHLTWADVEALLDRDLTDELEYYANHARETLRHAGLPDVFFRPCRRQDGTLCATLEGLLDEAKQDLGEVYWAAKILEQAENVQRFLDEGKPTPAARSAMLLQHTIDLREFRKWELPARVGDKQINHGRKGKRHTDDDERRWQQRAEALRRDGMTSKREISKQIEKETGFSWETIRRKI